MPSIQYNGVAPIHETAITGKQQKWFPGQIQQVSDADAALLKASGLGFVDEQVAPGDLTPATVAALQAQVSEYGVLPVIAKRRHIGTRIPGGRMGTKDNSTPRTYHRVFSTAGGYTQIRLIFANGSTSNTIAISKAAVRGMSDTSDFNKSASAWDAVTFGGSATGTVPVAGGSARRGYLLSDWIDYNSYSRSDGGSFPLIAARAYISTAGTISVFGNGVNDFTNWPTKPDGRIDVMRSQAGDHATTQTGFTSTTNESQSPLVGIQYRGAGSVITIMGNGDSITESVASTYIGDSWGMRAAGLLSNQAGVVVEWANIGWSGSFYSSVNRRFEDAFAAGILPDIALFPNGSPNSVSTTFDANIISASRIILAKCFAACQANDVLPISWTMLPADYTGSQAKQYGASDSFRRDWNAETLALAAKGMYGIDFSGVVSGSAHASGQVQFSPGMSSDGLHLNDAGNDAVADYLRQQIARLIRAF